MFSGCFLLLCQKQVDILSSSLFFISAEDVKHAGVCKNYDTIWSSLEETINEGYNWCPVLGIMTSYGPMFPRIVDVSYVGYNDVLWTDVPKDCRYGLWETLIIIYVVFSRGK